MPKNATKTTDIFKFLKGGGIRGYTGASLIVRNIKQNEIGNLVFDPTKHISAFKLHIEICKYFYEMHLYDVEKSNSDGIANRVKVFEYAFFNEEARNQLFKTAEKHTEYSENDAVKNTLSNWNSYISIINRIGDKPVDDDLLGSIFKQLGDTNYKCVSYSTTSINGGNTVKVSETIVDPIVKCIDDVISKGFVDLDTSACNIKISKDGVSFNYAFGRKTFNGQTTNSPVLTETEQVCTLITVYIGKLHADALTAKNEKSAEGKNAVIRKKNLSGVLKTLFSKYEPHTFKISNPTTKKVRMTDILEYFKNPANNEKIIFDLLVGSSIKKSIKLNDVINAWGFSIVNDHNELKVANLIEDYANHISLTDATSATDLMNIYSLFGMYSLKGIDTNFKEIGPIDLFFYGILIPNIIRDDSTTKTSKVSVNPIVDMCFKDLVCYFAQKENSIQRKQSFFKSFDGSLKQLVEYRNRIVSKNKVLDIALCNDIISPSQLKVAAFNHLFS
jgi:hypothetical protein